jgi:hypothetical protein
MLSAKRDVSAAKRFFKKMMGPSIVACHSQLALIRTPLTQKHLVLHERSGSCQRTACSGA